MKLETRLSILYETPFDWQSLLEFLRIRATLAIESVEQDTYKRSVQINGAPGLIAVTNDPAGSRLVVEFDRILSPHSQVIRERVSHLFDLSAEVKTIRKSLIKSGELGAIVRQNPGLRVPGAWDPFEMAVRAVVGQQVTVKAATTLMGRIAERAGSPADSANGEWRLFPSPRQIIDTDLSRIGGPSSRIETVARLAEGVVAGTVDFSSPDSDALCNQLTQVKGIGRWTAGYIAMRALRSGDCYPYGDLVLRKALSLDGELVSAAHVDRAFEEWRPWRAYAALYLWKRGAISPSPSHP